MVIKGIVQHIKYHSEDTGFTVALVEAEGDVITVVGTTQMLYLQEEVTMTGEWTYHNSFGEQFRFESIERAMPSTLAGIEAYLGSGLIPGVGKVMAKRIVEAFGEQTLEVLEETPERLLEIEGIGEKKYEKIERALWEHHSMKRVLVQLQSLNIPSNMAVKLYRHYGDEVAEVIRQNPYQIAEDVQGIGFKRADQIAKLLGVPKDSPFRLKAGLYYALMDGVNHGHCYLPKSAWLRRAAYLLEEVEENLEEAFMELQFDPRVHFVPLEDGEVACFPQHFYLAENRVAQKLMELASMSLEEPWVALDLALDEIEHQDGIAFAKAQRKGVLEAFSHGVYVITGGPGTGKTTALKAIISLAHKMGLSVALAAPTGRAAKRMTETTGTEASTIHRLLEYTYTGEGMFFQRDEDSPLDVDMVIVDETSMIDIQLMDHLLMAIKPGARLLLLGDVNQLPSVGPGNVLKDILDSELVPATYLTEVFRQAEESMIIKNAHRMNQGKLPTERGEREDFYFIGKRTHEEMALEIRDLVSHRLAKHYGIDPVEDIQVLTPMRKGEAGVDRLNERLQEALNPKDAGKKEVIRNRMTYREGDKVMQLRNNYQMKWQMEDSILDKEGEGVYNGDMGRIISIDEDLEELTVRMDDGKLVTYEFGGLEDLTLAYATTIHKAQGSEFKAVVIATYYGSAQLMNRNLLYTAVTRAKELVVIVGQWNALVKMVENAHVQPRFTMLKEKMIQWKAVREGSFLDDDEMPGMS